MGSAPKNVLEYQERRKRDGGSVRRTLNQWGKSYFLIAIPVLIVVLLIDWFSVPSTATEGEDATTRSSVKY